MGREREGGRDMDGQHAPGVIGSTNLLYLRLLGKGEEQRGRERQSRKGKADTSNSTLLFVVSLVTLLLGYCFFTHAMCTRRDGHAMSESTVMLPLFAPLSTPPIHPSLTTIRA